MKRVHAFFFVIALFFVLPLANGGRHPHLVIDAVRELLVALHDGARALADLYAVLAA